MNNELPCIKNKCLKYPICKHKEYIDCEELNNYCTRQIKQHNSPNYFHSELLIDIQKTLPNLKEITYHYYYRGH